MAKKITWNGQDYSIPQLANRIGITPAAMRYRLREWPRHDAITQPADTRYKKPERTTKASKSPADWVGKLEM